MKLELWFLLVLEVEHVTARKNGTRIHERKKKKKHKEVTAEESLYVAVGKTGVHLVESPEELKKRSDSHTEDWEDEDECETNRYEDDHGGHGSCDDHPIKLNQKKECQDEVYWYYCDSVCHSIYKDPSRMVDAYVGKFKCQEVLDAKIVPGDLLSEDDCSDKESKYYHSKFIDCYCRPDDHIAWVASLSILGTLFLAIKFLIFFVNNYRIKKKIEKEEALAQQRADIERTLNSLSDENETKKLIS